MSTVTVARDTSLPAITGYADTIKLCIGDIVTCMDLSDDYGHLNGRLIRPCLIKLQLSCQLILRDVRQLKKWCQDDFTLSFIIHESRLEKYKPEFVKAHEWIAFIQLIHETLREGDDFGSTGMLGSPFMTILFHATVLDEIAQDLIDSCHHAIDAGYVEELKQRHSAIMVQVHLFWDFFLALNTQAIMN